MDLLLTADKNKSHYVYIKDFNRLMCKKTKFRTKKHFWKYCLECFSSEKVFQKQIKFKNHFKQLAAPFKIYADFEYNLEGVKSNVKNDNALYTECFIYQDHVSCRFA